MITGVLGVILKKMGTVLMFLKRTDYTTSIQWIRKTQGKISSFVFNVPTLKDFEDTLFVGGGGIAKIAYIIRSLTKKRDKRFLISAYVCVSI